MAEPLKNMFFTDSSVKELAELVSKNFPSFPAADFLSFVKVPGWKSMELKEKMHHVARCLHQTLPPDYHESLRILKKIAPEVHGFEAMALPDFVEQFGLDDFDESIEALIWFTGFSSSEFAIRPFILREKEKVMKIMLKLSGDKNPNVRRFASEGCRPRLPWAMALPELQKDPSLILPILEKLKNDPSEFVRRSVANNLNDISKDHPKTVIQVCKKWKGYSAETDGIIKHALRTLLKKGNKEALLLFGFTDPKQVKVKSLKVKDKMLRIGKSTEFSFTFSADGRGKLRLEYAIHYCKANGKLSKKVFQIFEKFFAKGEHSLTRKISFIDMTTRKHYPGDHILAVHVNGVELARTEFKLVKGS